MAKTNQRKRTTARWTKRAALIAGAALGLVLIVRALMPHAIPVDTAVATRGALEVEVDEDGQTRVRDRYAIAAPIGGELERITIDPGTEVEAGTIVARIEPPRPALLDARSRSEAAARLAAGHARQRQAQMAVVRAREAKALADTDAKRQRALFEGGAISEAISERAETAAKVAATDLAAAEHERAAVTSEVNALEATLDPRGSDAAPLPVTAPTRGTVLRVVRESAGPVAAGAPLLEIGDPASLEIVVDVLSRDAERIAPGMVVYISTGNTPIRGRVNRVEPSAFTRVSALGVEEQRVNVIVDFDKGAHLGDGFRVDARIIIWRGENVLRVPASALFREHGQWAVYVVEDGRAHMRTVDIGHRGRLDVEITRGLSPGERVVVHPSDQVHEKKRVASRS